MYALLLIVAFGLLLWGLRGVPVLQYLFLLRFQLALALFLILFPVIALTVAPQMLGNLLVLEQPMEFVIVAGMVPMIAWLVAVQTFLVIRHAPERCHVAQLTVPQWVVKFRIPLFGVLALPILAGVVMASPGSPWQHVLWCGVGVVVALVILVVSTNVQYWFVDPNSPQNHFLLEPDRWVLRRLRNAPGLRCVVPGAVQRMLGPGYVDEMGELLPGHGLSMALFAVTTLLYFAGYFLLAPPTSRLDVPALFYLLILVASMGWVLTGAALYLDRWRVPVVLGVLAYSFLVFSLKETDHYFPFAESDGKLRPALAPLVPSDVVEAWLARERDGKPPILVVVAAAGGGIQASAWTAQVLTGLRQTDFGGEFARSLRLISSVSGGSVGTMYVVDAMSKTFDGDGDRLQKLVLAAGKSSLTASAWGLAYPDFLRVLSPFPQWNPTLDRAWVMEDVWRSRLSSANGNGRSPTFSDWIQGVREGWRPATIFNATIVNTGGRLLLGSTMVPEAPGATHLAELYKDQNISVVTAARLSATFPYITPVARPLLPDGVRGPQYYIADGGYYDNFGMATALDWLRGIINQEYGKQFRAILLLQIQLSPEPADDPIQSVQEEVLEKESHSWLYATLGPAITLTQVRTATQKARNSVDFSQLQTRLRERNDACLTRIVFYPDREGPLSWHLSKVELESVMNAWQSQVVQHKVEQVRRLFKSENPCKEEESPEPAERS